MTDDLGNVVSIKRAKRKPSRPAPPRPRFLSAAMLDGQNRVLPILANAMLALRAAPQIADAFTYDEMLRAPILARALPVVDDIPVPTDDDLPRPVRDTDVSQLQEFLQRNGLARVGYDLMHQAVDLRAQERAFHPVRDYLSSLVWDKTPRLEKWLCYYLGVAQSAYAAAIGRMFVIAMVARIFEPGCKADYVMVLEGEQGALKSTACRVLAGPWFSDSLPPVGHKDASEHVRGKWLIEIAEFSAFGRADTEALKAFISRQVERFRPAYGRKEVVEGRQCLFVGTTNKAAYLKDETGARRFWPVKVEAIDLGALAHDRDQLFAEAVHCYRVGERWWPDAAFEREHIRPEQDARFDADPWEEAIAAYVGPLAEVRLAGITSNVLNMEIKDVGTADRNRIKAVLGTLGFVPGEKDERGRPYVRRSQGRHDPHS